MSVNSSPGNEDTGTSDKCTFNEVLRSLDETNLLSVVDGKKRKKEFGGQFAAMLLSRAVLYIA